MSQFYQKDDVTRRPITIIEDKESFYKLSDGQMIKKEVFPKYYYPFINESTTQNNFTTTPNFTSDSIDPNTFFNSLTIPIEKLKTVDTSRMTDNNDMDGSYVVKNTTNQVKSVPQQPRMNENLTFQNNQPIPDHTNTDVSQYKVFDNDDDAYDDFVKKSQPNYQPPQTQPPQLYQNDIDNLFEDEKIVYGIEEATIRKEARLRRSHIEPNTNYSNSIPQSFRQQELNDPSEMMFKTFKRNHDISINVSFNDKIGQPEFVKMMMENLEGDIINYYKKLIMNNIMNNLKYIEDEVEKNLRFEIFGEEIIKKSKSKTKTKPRNKTPKNVKINDISYNPLTVIEDTINDNLITIQEITLNTEIEEITPNTPIEEIKKSNKK